MSHPHKRCGKKAMLHDAPLRQTAGREGDTVDLTAFESEGLYQPFSLQLWSVIRFASRFFSSVPFLNFLRSLRPSIQFSFASFNNQKLVSGISPPSPLCAPASHTFAKHLHGLFVVTSSMRRTFTFSFVILLSVCALPGFDSNH